MNLWIVTIGSSDVQLDSDRTNQEKGRTEKQRSDKVWSYWYNDDLKAQHHDIAFEPKPLFKDKDETYRIAPRILGTVYQESSETVQQEIWRYLTFPLLDNFVQALAHYPSPGTIAVLLTDQSAVFDDRQRRKPKSPYWQDTCELKPILQRYFQDRFPNIPCQFMMLTPETQAQSLDNWNAVLELVRDQFRTLKIADQPIQINPEEVVYVSHQAGTPAISSAVQFCSLAQFGDRVRFLVSNEYNPELTGFVESSSYLRGIKREQAKKLLENYDYAGVDQLVGKDLTSEDRILLDAALKWNVAKFDAPQPEGHESEPSDPSFLEILKHHPKFASEVAERTREANWWWIAYEEVYLALIRKAQGNIVEAFFHSFRAFEYIFAAWGRQQLGQYVEFHKNIPCLNPAILDDEKDYFSAKRCKDVSDFKKLREQLEALKDKTPEEVKNDDRVQLNMATLCKIFRAFRYKDYKRDCEDLKIFWDTNKEKNVCEKRNLIVHQVEGMSDSSLYDYWDVKASEEQEKSKEWENKILRFLNFIVKEDFPQGSESLQDASLMVKVHQELARAIAQL